MTHPGTAVAMIAVAVASMGLSILAYRAYRRSGNSRLRFLVAAFLVFVVKALFATYSVQTESIHHETLELILGCFDVVALTLILLPFLWPRK